MAKIIYLEGYRQFSRTIGQLTEKQSNVVVMFCGSKDPYTRLSWCPDCRDFLPLLQHVWSQFDKKNHRRGTFIEVGVGSSDEWYDPNNHFRTDPYLQIIETPTLINFRNSNYRLEKSDCKNPPKVYRFFEYFFNS